MVVGNKTDRPYEEREVTSEQGRKLALVRGDVSSYGQQLLAGHAQLTVSPKLTTCVLGQCCE